MVALEEIFDIQYGNKFDLNKMTFANPLVNFVGRSAKNNGVTNRVDEISNKKPYQEGLITVALGGSILASFLQVKKFYTGQNIAVLKEKVKLSKNQKLFYCMAIKSNEFRFSAFGREANRTLRKLRVPSLDEIPKWVNDYDISQFDKASLPLNTTKIELDVTQWKEFIYDELFDIERGRGPRRKDLDGSGTTPFVSSTDTNNGVTDMTIVAPIHKGNTIGVNRNGSVAEAFYQKIPFCSTEDVHIFNTKFELNPYIAMFLNTIIKKEAYRYNYGRKWGIARMKKSIIKLPINSNGNPNWQYMENYIKTLPFSSVI